MMMMSRRLSRCALVAVTACLAFSVAIPEASARCSSGSSNVWPEDGASIASTQVIFVEGVNRDRAWVKELGALNPVFVAADETVPLKVLHIYESKKHKSAATLVPTKALTPGKEYALTINKPALDNRITIPAPTEAELRAEEERKAALKTPETSTLAKYKVSTESDDIAPRWKKAPKFRFARYGQIRRHPVSSVTIETLIEEESANIFYVARAVRLNDDTDIQEYPIFSKGDRVLNRIGYGVCVGEIDFKKGQTYQLTLQPVDSAGNSGATSDPLKLVGPS